jgi:hypothetical protein
MITTPRMYSSTVSTATGYVTESWNAPTANGDVRPETVPSLGDAW